MTLTFPLIDWPVILPVILVVIGGVLVLAWDAFFRGDARSFVITLSLGTLGAAMGATIFARPVNETALSLGGLYLFDGFTQFVFFLILLSSFISILVSASQPELEKTPAGEYYCLILFATCGMMLIAATRNMLMMFIGLEIFSISLYVLAGYLRSRLQGNEAALKYFLLGSFASGFLLYGMALIYGTTGSVDIMKAAEHLAQNPASRSLAFLLGVGFVVMGLGFKVAAVPFHMWTPDVYEGSPTSVTAFMSVGPKAAAFAAFFRIVISTAPHIGAEIGAVLWAMAALTMTVANVVAIWQSNIKRMLAYSSISHAGYLLVALVAAKNGGGLATGGFLYYMLVYVFMNLGAFCVVVATGAGGKERVEIEEYAGMGDTRPGLAFAMAIFMISLAGLPPTGGFVAKFYVFSAAVKAGHVILAVIAVLNSVIAVYYYLRIVVVMYMREAPAGAAAVELGRTRPYAIATLVFGVVATLNLGIFPATFMEIAQRSAALLN